MSDQAKYVSWAMLGTKYGGSDLLVLIALAERADSRGMSYPSIQTISADTRCSERAVQYAIKKLVADGWLSLKRQGGERTANLYRLALGRLKVAAEQEQTRRSEKYSAEPTKTHCAQAVEKSSIPVDKSPKPVENAVDIACKTGGFKEQGVQPLHSRGAMVAAKGCNGCTQTPMNPHRTPIKDQQQQAPPATTTNNKNFIEKLFRAPPTSAAIRIPRSLLR